MRRLWKGTLAFFIVSITFTAWAVPPGEVASLDFCAGSKTCLSWSNLGSVQYRLYRGTQASLPALQSSSVDSCLVRMTTGLTSTGSVLSEVPPPGELLWYLVTAKNCDGEGSPGSGTSGTRTLNSSGDCVAPTCNDGIQNGSETDVDCGGGGCPACAIGKACCSGGSCSSGSCGSGVCVGTGPGGFCSTGSECEAGLFCVDNVCCTSACTATCGACDLPGTTGTCTPVASGSDPDAECGGVSCTNFYWGWTGDTCYRKANVTASQAMCNGANACRTQTQECGLQTTQGSAALTCNATCQDPTAGTCTGTTAGTCTNVNPGNQTCGLGVCQVTVPQCANGAPNTCTPGTPTTETCNNLDDNCDGTIDNGAFADSRESNNSCGTYNTLPTVGSDQTLTQNTLTLYPSGDFDYFRINATESDATCACCDIFCTDEDYQLTITLTVPPGAGSYQFCTDAACGTVTNSCQTVNAGASATWVYSLDGACGEPTTLDSYSVYVRISPGTAPGYACLPYTLSYNFDAGRCL